jgi:CIC family chloride channel protein
LSLVRPLRVQPETLTDDRLTPLRESIATGRYLLLIAAPMGLLVGVAIAGYDWLVNEVLWKHVLQQPLFVQLASPTVAMLLAGLLLQLFRVRSPSMADEVVKAYHEPDGAMPMETAAAKFAASVATMGLGASAGMEGASKWLGATIGSALQRAVNALGIRPLRWDVRSALLTGGSAGIAAIFRAPLSGAIMGVESPYKRDIAHDALLSSLVAAATSFWAFTRLRPATAYFPVSFHYTLESRDLLVAVPLGLSAGLASHLFLWTLAWLRSHFNALPVPGAVRALLGGLLLSVIAWIALRVVGHPVTLQAGLPVANELLNGKYALALCATIFALKLLATAITFGAGGVGGLFVPTATIGAALGACWDAVLAPSHPGVYTLLGIAAFAGASYNSLLFAAVFIAESTGNVFLAVPALIASTLAYVVSAGVSNSGSQRLRRTGREQTSIPLSRVMSTAVVTATPGQSLDGFAHSVLLKHPYKALPVVNAEGVLQGLIALTHLRAVPMAEWKQVRVAQALDPRPRTLGPHDSTADAARALEEGPYDYLPIVDPVSQRLLGIVSRSDLPMSG